MTEIEIKYNHFLENASIKIDGEIPKVSSNLNKSEKTFQEWIEKLPEVLLSECNTRIFSVIFYGGERDYRKLKEVLNEANIRGFQFKEILLIKRENDKAKLAKIEEILNKIFNNEFIRKNYNDKKICSIFQNTSDIVDCNEVLDLINEYINEMEISVSQEIKNEYKNIIQLILNNLYYFKKQIQKVNDEKNITNEVCCLIKNKINRDFKDIKVLADQLIDKIAYNLEEISVKEIKKKSKKFSGGAFAYTNEWRDYAKLNIQTVELKKAKQIICKIVKSEKEMEDSVALEINKIIKSKLNTCREGKVKLFIIDELIKYCNKDFKFAIKDWNIDLEFHRLKIEFDRPKSWFGFRIPKPMTYSIPFEEVSFNEIEDSVLKEIILRTIKSNSSRNKLDLKIHLSFLLSSMQKDLEEYLMEFNKNIVNIDAEVKNNLKEQSKLKELIAINENHLKFLKEIKSDMELALKY